MNNTREIIHNGTTITEMDFGDIVLRGLPRHPEYWAGNDGFIYSTKRGQVPTRLKAVMNKKLKMWHVTLYRPDRRKLMKKASGTYLVMYPEPVAIHTLIASVWLPPRPSEEHEIDHRDEDRRNNRPGNLRWATTQENNAFYHANHPDKSVLGNSWPGEKNPAAKLSDQQGLAVIALRGRMSALDVAGLFGVTRTTVCKIWRGRSWRHLPR